MFVVILAADLQKGETACETSAVYLLVAKIASFAVKIRIFGVKAGEIICLKIMNPE